MRTRRSGRAPRLRARLTTSTPSLLKDGAWTLIFNLLTKTQGLAIIASGALIGGVVDVGALSAAVAAAALGAGLADFGYSYECGRLLAAQPWRDTARAVGRQIPARILFGGLLTVVAFYISVGHRRSGVDATLYLAIFVLGSAITGSQIIMQALNALHGFKQAATILGGVRVGSAVASLSIAWLTATINFIVVGLAVAELTGAVILAVFFVARSRELPLSGVAVKLGHGHIWLGVGNTINSLVNRSDVLLVGAISSPVVLGIYSIASQFENAIESLAMAPAGPLTIYTARAKARGDDFSALIGLARRATVRLGSVGALGVVMLYLAFDLLLPFQSGDLRFSSAGYAIVVCAWSAVPASIAGVYLSALAGLRRYTLMGAIRVANGILAVALFLLLTPAFGVVGAATSAAVRDGSLCLLSIFVARRILRSPDERRSSSGRTVGRHRA